MEPVMGMRAPVTMHAAAGRPDIPRTVQARVISTTVVADGSRMPTQIMEPQAASYVGGTHVRIPQQHAGGPHVSITQHHPGVAHIGIPQHHPMIAVSHGAQRAVPLIAPAPTTVHMGHAVPMHAAPLHQASGVADLLHPQVRGLHPTGAAPSSAELLRQGRLVGERAISKEDLMHMGLLMEVAPERAPGPPRPADPAGPEARNAMHVQMESAPMEPIQGMSSHGMHHQSYEVDPYNAEKPMQQGYHESGHPGDYSQGHPGDYSQGHPGEYSHGHPGEHSGEAFQPYEYGQDPFSGGHPQDTQFFTGTAPAVNPYETHVFDGHGANPYAVDAYGHNGPAPSIHPQSLR